MQAHFAHRKALRYIRFFASILSAPWKGFHRNEQQQYEHTDDENSPAISYALLLLLTTGHAISPELIFLLHRLDRDHNWPATGPRLSTLCRDKPIAHIITEELPEPQNYCPLHRLVQPLFFKKLVDLVAGKLCAGKWFRCLPENASNLTEIGYHVFNRRERNSELTFPASIIH